MNEAAFVITMHPDTVAGDEARVDYFARAVLSLATQACDDWRALFVGARGDYLDLIADDPRFEHIRFAVDAPGEGRPVGCKVEKIEAAVERIATTGGCKWVTRLDDDDMISEKILARLVEESAHLKAVRGVKDREQFYFDTTDGGFYAERRPSTPNTCFMRFNRARHILNQEHGSFGRDLANWIEVDDPVYLRTLHGASVTSDTAERYKSAGRQLLKLPAPPPGFGHLFEKG